MHTSHFITDKNLYHGQYRPEIRKEILFTTCQFVRQLNLKTVSVVIDKKRINRPVYHVLKNALTYNIQRIENDLNTMSPDARFIIITDEGRVGKMRETARCIQKINYIPSKFGSGSYRKEIQNLIEDPLPKDSAQSFFIQIADMIAFIVSLFAKRNLCKPKVEWANRIRQSLSYGDEILLMNMLKNCMNTKASRSNEYGVVYYPK